MVEAITLFNSRRSPADENARLRQEAVDSLYRALTGAVDGLRNIPIFLKECFERESWKHERIFAGGTRQNPISFHEFVHAPYPVGLGADYDTLSGFLDGELLELFDKAAKRPHGGDRNPYGRAGKPEEIKLYNIQDDSDEPKKDKAPTGTSAQATVRRLTKASSKGDEKAAQLLRDVSLDKVSANAAAIEMGWRTKPTPVQEAMRAWRKMSNADQEYFLEWAQSQLRRS